MVCTVVPALALIAAMSLLTDVNLGLRYILPALPLLFVAAGAWVKGAAFRRRGVRWLTAGLIGAALLSTGAQFPHYIGAFNVLAGGPQNGHQWLAHSNLDWGQDLPLLQEYMENEQIEEVDLAYYGRVPPEAYGIQFRPAPLSPEPGRVTAISANYALGLPYLLYVPGEEGLVWMPPHAFSSYAEHTPTRVLGRSLYLYDWRER